MIISSPYARFYDRWGETYHPAVKPSLAHIADVEKQLGFAFPAVYVGAVTQTGTFSVRVALLDEIVDQRLDLRDISEVLNIGEIHETMSGWREAGMPKEMIPFASDSMGNIFAFDARDSLGGRRPDCPIYFWDHDFDEVSLEASGFDEWIAKYNAIAGMQ